MKPVTITAYICREGGPAYIAMPDKPGEQPTMGIPPALKNPETRRMLCRALQEMREWGRATFTTSPQRARVLKDAIIGHVTEGEVAFLQK